MSISLTQPPLKRRPKRRTFAALGYPGQNGQALSTNQVVTLFDSGDTSKGGVSGYTTSPGVVTNISIFSDAISGYEWQELLRVNVYYDGESTPSIQIPMRRFSNSAYSTANYDFSWRNPYLDWYSSAGGITFSLSFRMPIPFKTRCKVEIVCPSTGTHGQMWTLVDYTYDDDRYGDQKLRMLWWDHEVNGTLTTSADRIGTNTTTGRADTSATTIDELDGWDAGWGTRLYGALDSSATTVEVYNGPSIVRNLPVGVKDPRTGAAITNITTALAPDVFAWIENECVKITAISGNTLTVVRAQNDPITGAATTAAAHADLLNVTRIVGPCKVEGLFLVGIGMDAWMEGPVAVFVDKESGFTTGGNCAVMSGGAEDFFGCGWYVAQGSHFGNPNVGNMTRVVNAETSFWRWFIDDPLYADYGVNYRFYNGESGQGSPTNIMMGSTLFVYTAY